MVHLGAQMDENATSGHVVGDVTPVMSSLLACAVYLCVACGGRRDPCHVEPTRLRCIFMRCCLTRQPRQVWGRQLAPYSRVTGTAPDRAPPQLLRLDKTCYDNPATRRDRRLRPLVAPIDQDIVRISKANGIPYDMCRTHVSVHPPLRYKREHAPLYKKDHKI